MTPFFWLAAGVTAGSLAAGPVPAQPAEALHSPPAGLATPPAPPAPLAPPAGLPSLRAALDAAWPRALAAREAEGQQRRADAERAVAASVWAAAPSLALSHRADRWPGQVGRRETELGVALPLWLPGQRMARAATAEAAAAQAQAAAELARWRLAGELREAAWHLAAVQAEAVQAGAQVQGLKRLADDVQRRVQAGDLARADALAAQAEHLAAQALHTDLLLQQQAALARWTLLTGLAAAPQLGPELGPGLGSTMADEAPASAHPELLWARQSAALARQRLDLVRRSGRDAPELSLGVRQDSPGRGEATQGSLVVGLRLPWGTDGRNRPLEAEALAELDLAQAQAQHLRDRLDSDTATARAAQRSAQAQLAAETARARLLRERAALIDKSFRAGETPLPDLLRALAAAQQADSAVARQTAALGLAHARLQQALGRLP